MSTNVISSYTNIPIPDNGTTSSTLNVSGMSGFITDLNVELDINHSFDGDLEVYLVAPTGQEVELFTDVGGSSDNFTGTVLDNEASTSIVSGSAPFTGSYTPEGDLSSIYGINPNGAWKLKVTDDSSIDTGTLNSWKLEIAAVDNSTYQDIGIEPSIPIPDNGTTSSTLNVSGMRGVITDLNVKLDINHTFDADLDVYLITPTGQQIELFTDVGSISDNFRNTVLDNEASTPITSGSAPFTGSYIPEGNLSSIYGTNPNGVWKLKVLDDSSQDVGNLNSWGLEITTIGNSPPIGIVAINDTTPRQGQILTASNTLTDADGLGAISYTWKANTTVLATGNTYKVKESEVGKTISVIANYTDQHGTAESMTSATTSIVANVNDVPRGSVTIRGTPTQGQTLRVANTLTDADGLGTITYHWKADGSNVGTGSTYTLTGAEVGKTITATASYIDGHGTTENVISSPTNPVIPNAPSTGYHEFSTTPSTAISSNNTLSSTLNVSGMGGLISDLNVKVNINHTYDADLDVYLITPSGQQIELFTDVGGSSDNFTNTILDNEASTYIVNGSAPFTGSYIPEGSLSSAYGVNPNGVWKLQVTDDAGGDEGNLISWGLGITTTSNPLPTNPTYQNLVTESPIQIPDNGTISPTLNVGGMVGLITDLNVKVDINHTFDGDLDVYLVAPTGQEIELFTDVGDSYNNFTNTVIDNEASTSIASGNAPFTGAYIPEGNLSSIYGINPNGVWKLKIIDDSGTDIGTLNSWGLEITTALAEEQNHPPIGVVTISDTTPTQGQTLTAFNTLSDEDGLDTISYTWKTDTTVLAIGNTYTVRESEVGKAITVVASYTDQRDTVESVTSPATSVVTNVNDAPTGSVIINGTTTQGQVLVATNTLNDADGLDQNTITYQWKAGGSNIGTGDTYTLTAAEVGKTVTAIAGYIDGHGTVESIASVATSAVASIPVASTPAVNVVGNDFLTGENGDTAIFQVSLAAAPVRDVFVTFSTNDTTEALITTGANLTFTSANWNVAKTLILTGQNDVTDVQDVNYQLTGVVTTSDVKYLRVTVNPLTLTNQDDGLDVPDPPLVLVGDRNGIPTADVLQGMGGNDSIYGGYLPDDLSGGAGDDELWGGYDSDFLYGEDGNDKLYGEQGKDSLTGGAGNDTLDGGLNADTLVGGAGNDTYYLGYDEPDVIADNGLSTDVDTVIMPYQLTTYALPTGIENGTISPGTSNSGLTGNEGNNMLQGNDGRNNLIGAVGRDSLFGGAGNDMLNGGTGDDVLQGGTGSDSLTGGAGKDIFLFDTGLTANVDKITDFTPIDDTIQLENQIFIKLTVTGTLDASQFVKGMGALDSNDYIIYNPATGVITYDADGSGVNQGVQVVVVGINLAITNADFVVI